MHTLWDRLESTHHENDILDHPFYRRCSAGELSRDELAIYAGQYAHVVRALPVALRRAAQEGPWRSRKAVEEHSCEEAWHAHLWSKFAEWCGAGTEPAAPAKETKAMIDSMVGFSSWQDGLIGVYALESTQGPVAESKLKGLTRYGLSRGPATVYFEIHTDRDDEHSKELRDQLELHLGPELDNHVARATEIWRANWRVLDGVERLAAVSGSAR